jgi:glutamate-ammonia-ligase adenylyltransferase
MRTLPPFSGEIRRRLEAVGWLDDPRAAAPLEAVWSGPDPDGAVGRLLDFVEAAARERDVLADADAARRLAYLCGISRRLSRDLARHPGWLFGEYDDLIGKVRSTLARVAADDAAGMIDVAEGARLLSDMADEVVGEVLREETEDSPPMAILAMGKWGGRELNYWSDIDLLFVFEGGSPSAAAAANRAATRVMRRLGGQGTGEPIIRADADLRPEGSRGPLARSLDAYRSYYERWAEPWEFQALLKTRFAAGDPDLGKQFVDLVGEVLWPETIDPDAIRSLRALKARTEASANPSDLKRAEGGIRDIEFAVQMLQLVHGRFDPDLRRTGTLELLDALSEGSYIAAEDAERLAESYRWLRNAEHRIQLWDLHPTHVVPSDPSERERLARAMGYRDTAARIALDAFDADLVEHRARVRRIHEDLYYRPLLEAFAATPTAFLSREGAARRLAALGFRDVERAVRIFRILTQGLSRRSRLMQQMLPMIIDWLADSPDPDLGLDQVRLLAASLPDHTELITTLTERPVVGQRLAHLLGSSRLLGRYLDRIPEFVNQLDDDEAIVDLRPRDELEERLRRRIEARADPEEKLGTLRRFARRQIVRVAARDLLGMAEVGRTMDDLTAAADAAVSVATSLADGDRGFAVIAMGRWGGEELSYASDLDVLYVFDEPLDADSALGRATRLRELLAAPAKEGIAWDLDANLRPEGKSGPLVRSLDSYAAYYDRWAETWEFQSLIKARPVAGDPELGARFMDLVSSHLWMDPFPSERIIDIRRMKARVEKERVPLGEDPDFHLKLGPGGLVDVEFLVQLLQLRHGGRDPRVRLTSTRRAIAALADAGVLAAEDARDLRAAYEFCTHVRNRLYLQAGRAIDSLPRDPADERRLAISLGYERRSDLREEYKRLTRRARRIFEDLFFA